MSGLGHPNPDTLLSQLGRSANIRVGTSHLWHYGKDNKNVPSMLCLGRPICDTMGMITKNVQSKPWHPVVTVGMVRQRHGWDNLPMSRLGCPICDTTEMLIKNVQSMSWLGRLICGKGRSFRDTTGTIIKTSHIFHGWDVPSVVVRTIVNSSGHNMGDQNECHNLGK